MAHPLEQISEGEKKFELWRTRLGLPLGLAAAAACYAAAASLPFEQRRLGAILVLVVVFWITEAIPIPATALLGPALCVLAGVGSPQEVFRAFSDPIIFLFIGSFLIARAMTVNGLDRRVAIAILCSPAIKGSPERIRLAIGATSLIVSMWMSNTAAVAILFPIVVGISDTLDRIYSVGSSAQRQAGRRYTVGLMLITAYAASIGGVATPVGSPPNLIGIGMLDRMTGRHIPFFEWMLFGVPVSVVLFCVLAWLMRLLHPAPDIRLDDLDAEGDRLSEGLRAWGRPQTYTLLAFLTAVALWIVPGIIAIAQGTDSPLYHTLSSRLHEGIVAILAASLLFLLPVKWGPVAGALSWRDAVKIDWGTILLFGGGLSLGGLLYSSGLAQHIAEGLLGADSHVGVWTIMVIATLFGIVVTETTSNTAAASMVVPVTIAVAKAAGISPIPATLGVTVGASLAFMLPVSTPPNAIVYGSGRVTILQMLRAGIVMDAIGYLLLLVLLRILCPWMGLM